MIAPAPVDQAATIMIPGKPSASAEGVARLRALHQLVDDDPKIFPDPLALPIVGSEARRWLDANIEWQQSPAMRRTRAMVLIRARFAEDELLSAIEHGTAQYVILGAGLDTFAYRRRDLADRLTVFEVDHPATQVWKRERLSAAGIPEPPHLRYVSIDFNAESLGACLAAAGLRRDAPAFFAWLGVIYYLPPESIADTLQFIGSQHAGNQVVFDFGIANSALPPDKRAVWDRLNQHMTRIGEPWKTWHVPEALEQQLREFGFDEVHYLGPEQATRRYLNGRTDLPELGPFTALMSAATSRRP
jgi:methyltransferase (TIGR00027 family)